MPPQGGGMREAASLRAEDDSPSPHGRGQGERGLAQCFMVHGRRDAPKAGAAS